MKLKHISLLIMLLVTAVSTYSQTDNMAFTYQKPLFDFNYAKPTFKLQREQLSNTNKLLHYAILTGYREGVKPITGVLNSEMFYDQVTGTARLAMYNLSVQDMLTNGATAERVVLQVKDPSKYVYDPKYGDREAWMRKNAHCYEMAVPREAIFSVHTMRMIRADLASRFNLRIMIEKRELTTSDGKKYKADVYLISELN